MFDNLSKNFTKIFEKITKRGFLSEDDVNDAMREIRIALLEADVALPVVKDFIARVKDDIIGKEIIKAISPGHMVVKLVQDHLTKTLGDEFSELNFNVVPPAVIMMVGLQGSGKTTSSAKLALRLKQRYNKKLLLTSLDTYRPAAQKQLEILASQAEIPSLPIISGESPRQITARAMNTAKLEGYDIVILDTAGRLHIDNELMAELHDIKQASKPCEIILTADSMTGQDAVNVAKGFHESLQLTGVILTRIDGDSRGGAALSIRAVTGCPIKFLGTGEKLSEFTEFHPERLASRILDKGDIISLVERAAEAIEQQDAEKLAQKLNKGAFDLNDLAAQIKNIRKMGGVGGLMGMLPGIKRLKDQLDQSKFDERLLLRQEAIISSMTIEERKHPKILNASRKRRIALGCGLQVADVNRLLKQYFDMSTMVKKFSKMDKKSLLRTGISNLFS